MAAARIKGSARAGRLRLSFHVSTNDHDTDLAADVLLRHVTSSHPAALLQPDGSPRRQMLTGRPAHWMKEAIERYVTFAARAERTLPGIYRWAPAAKK